MTDSFCPRCGRSHQRDAAYAIGRFSPGGTIGYRSRRGGPIRATRKQAEDDSCRTMAATDHRDIEADQ